MNTAILVALIAATATIAASALSLYLTKSKEREAAWRSQKLEHYKAFMAALNAMAGPPASAAERITFANAANNIFLVGSHEVLWALRAYLDCTSDSNPTLNRQEHDELLTRLIVAIRRDLGVVAAEVPPGYMFYLWSGKIEGA